MERGNWVEERIRRAMEMSISFRGMGRELEIGNASVGIAMDLGWGKICRVYRGNPS